MRIRDAMILAFLLCLVEALSVNIETMTPSPGGKIHVLSRLSAGFPFQSIEYTRPDGDTPNTGSASEGLEPDAGVRVERPLLVCDALAMALLGVLLATLVLSATRTALATEIMVGVVAGALVLGLGDSPRFYRPWLSNGMGIVVLVAIPLSVCALSGRHKHPNVLLAVLSCAGGLAFVRAGLIAAAALDGDPMFLEPGERLRPWLVCAGISVVLAGISFAMRLLGRRVLRHSFPWSRVARTPAASEPCSECNNVSSAKPEENARRWIVGTAAILLVVTLYVGAHLSVVRDLRHDALATDGGRTETTILAKLETLTQPLVGRVRAQITETVSSSFRGGINARYQRAMLVNGEDLYCASFEKHLLIPWVQVEVVSMGTVADVQQRAMRHKRALSHEPSPARTKGPSATERK